jgi:hypothetical protein
VDESRHRVDFGKRTHAVFAGSVRALEDRNDALATILP